MEDELVQSKDCEVSNIERLTYWLNVFGNRLIAAVIDLNHYKNIKENNPKYQTFVNGQPVGVDELIEGRRRSIQSARGNISYIRTLIEADRKGELEKVWSDEAILSPVENYQEAKKADAKPEGE